jgi:hypothetical protein
VNSDPFLQFKSIFGDKENWREKKRENDKYKHFEENVLIKKVKNVCFLQLSFFCPKSDRFLSFCRSRATSGPVYFVRKDGRSWV